MHCRFENRRRSEARVLHGFVESIQARSAHELDSAFQCIDDALGQGYWVALILDYELGYWLEPAFMPPHLPENDTNPGKPRLTALVYQSMAIEAPWSAPHIGQPPMLKPVPRINRRSYLDNVHKIRSGIAAGNFYQVNYTLPIDIHSPIDPEQLYRHLANQHPSAYAAYIETSDRTIASFSPELFVARQADKLTVRPMKGTAPRHADPEEDQRAAQTLLTSQKDKAENLMIVDLLRNDLGRVALPGSVKVEQLFTLEAYTSVWTLTSTITAQAPELTLPDLLRALFPCGSITGAPKVAAMKAIRELETSPRGIYCGSLGWLAPNGDLELNVAIRTLEMFDNNNGVFGVGGGVVFDSVPDTEWQECLWKARIIGADPQ